MSKETLSPSQRSTGITRGQVMKLLEMSEYGLMKSKVFAGVPTAKVDEFIKSLGPNIRDIFVEFAERRFKAFLGSGITVNYDVPNAIGWAIKANAFDKEIVGINIDGIPLVGTGEVVEYVREVCFEKEMCISGLMEALKKKGVEDGYVNGYIFANPLTALTYTLRNPGVQKKYPLVVLFYVDESLCSLIFGCSNHGRVLALSTVLPNGYSSALTRFLAVPAPVISK